jgi:RNA polymerase sigma-70 factor (ECF subfamily)
MVKDERTRELYVAIDRLKYEQRVALTLHCFNDMSYKEVAEVMEVSLSKVETLIFRAKKNLKKILTEK